MENRPKGAVEQWRGFDPEWEECGGLTYANLLVRAPCDEVARALQQHSEMPKQMGDLLAGEGPLTGIREEPVYVYQLRGHDWTQVEYFGTVLDSSYPRDLSRQQSTLAFERWSVPSSGGVSYVIFGRGELIEAFDVFYDNPIYQGADGQADLQRKLAEGWQISHDHTFEFFSKRGTKLDIESPEECYARLDRAVEELGLFIACQPWGFNPELGRVDRGHNWGRELFAAARILYRTERDQTPQSEQDNTKLILEPPPYTKRGTKIILE